MHSENRGRLLEEGLIPVEFISYGVQDIKFTRVFSFILVKVSDGVEMLLSIYDQI